MAHDVIDLTDRIRELERSNSELEQFAYVASHDLQEPARNIQACLEMFVKRYGDGLDDGAMAFLNHALDASGHMRRLLDDLLAFARVGRAGDEATSVDLNEVVRAVVAALGPAANDAAIELGSLPTVTGNRTELELVFRNLIANALKFRRDDHAAEVRISADSDGARWAITIDDNGIGIPAGERQAVFEMFRRLHPRSRFPGTGMGLALCRRVLEAHGGTISAGESPTGGTSIRIELEASEETP